MVIRIINWMTKARTQLVYHHANSADIVIGEMQFDSCWKSHRQFYRLCFNESEGCCSIEALIIGFALSSAFPLHSRDNHHNHHNHHHHHHHRVESDVVGVVDIGISISISISGGSRNVEIRNGSTTAASRFSFMVLMARVIGSKRRSPISICTKRASRS
ncbi:hypothetical protein M0804_005809 [Polistes exclamans]|nr:hypothetical protein M0804_005809 [Polistes exclamans]